MKQRSVVSYLDAREISELLEGAKSVRKGGNLAPFQIGPSKQLYFPWHYCTTVELQGEQRENLMM